MAPEDRLILSIFSGDSAPLLLVCCLCIFSGTRVPEAYSMFVFFLFHPLLLVKLCSFCCFPLYQAQIMMLQCQNDTFGSLSQN